MRPILLAAAMMAPAAAVGQTTPPANAAPPQVAVHVSVKTPAGAPRALVEAGMVQSAPIYAKVPGLIRKYFTIGQADLGGIYLFKDRPAAQAWFSAAWRDKATATYGSQPVVTYFDVPLVVDNGGGK